MPINTRCYFIEKQVAEQKRDQHLEGFLLDKNVYMELSWTSLPLTLYVCTHDICYC